MFALNDAPDRRSFVALNRINVSERVTSRLMFSKQRAVCAAYKLSLRHRWHWSQGEEKDGISLLLLKKACISRKNLP